MQRLIAKQNQQRHEEKESTLKQKQHGIKLIGKFCLAYLAIEVRYIYATNQLIVGWGSFIPNWTELRIWDRLVASQPVQLLALTVDI